MERKDVLNSSQEESDEGRTRRVYSITETGRERLKQGLEYMLRRKRFLDEIEKYYRKHFPEAHVNGKKENV